LSLSSWPTAPYKGLLRHPKAISVG
jgi:hypothetical protein